MGPDPRRPDDIPHNFITQKVYRDPQPRRSEGGSHQRHRGHGNGPVYLPTEARDYLTSTTPSLTSATSTPSKSAVSRPAAPKSVPNSMAIQRVTVKPSFSFLNVDENVQKVLTDRSLSQAQLPRKVPQQVRLRLVSLLGSSST